VSERLQACYTIRVAAERCGMHEQSLRMYERLGLIKPRRSPGNIRLFSDSDIEQIRFIKQLVDDQGVNLAGAKIILHLHHQMQELQRELERLRG
jgi:MerR family transcriptional regulator, heat shock protein HspR